MPCLFCFKCPVAARKGYYTDTPEEAARGSDAIRLDEGLFEGRIRSY